MRLSKRMVSAIVSLTPAVSGMEVYFFSPVYYSGPCSGFAFPGAAIHRSLVEPCGSLMEGPMKLCVFYD